jgi:hypothetical protein
MEVSGLQMPDVLEQQPGVDKSATKERNWRMIIIDCNDGSQRIRERKLTTLEVSLAVRYWPAEQLNAVAIFWPDWAPPIEISFCAKPRV